MPDIMLVGYGTTQTYQIRCHKCHKQFFPGSKIEFFCDNCLRLPLATLSKYITSENYSAVQCVGNVVGWENRVTTSSRRSRHNYNKVYKRDEFKCQYCGYDVRTNKRFLPLHIDHVIPFSYGGGYKMDNLVVACADCNHIANNKVFTTFEAKKKYILQRRLEKGLFVSNYHIMAYELREITA